MVNSNALSSEFNWKLFVDSKRKHLPGKLHLEFKKKE
jgi:hypothetical protein